DPLRRRLVMFGKGQCAFWPLPEANQQSVGVQVTPTGDTATILAARSPGFVYHPPTDRFVVWHGGSAVWLLHPETFEMVKVPLDQNNAIVPTAARSDGTYGRFWHDSANDTFGGITHVKDPVWLFALPKSVYPTPPTPPDTIA